MTRQAPSPWSDVCFDAPWMYNYGCSKSRDFTRTQNRWYGYNKARYSLTWFEAGPTVGAIERLGARSSRSHALEPFRYVWYGETYGSCVATSKCFATV